MMQSARYMEKGFLQNEDAVKLVHAPGSLYEHTVVTNDFLGVPTKCRADQINVAEGYITDLKSTAGALDSDSIRATIDKWGYGLSAALYSAVMEQHYGKKFDFYWVFCGKAGGDCAVYKMSEKTRGLGLDECRKAAKIYKHCKETGIWLAPEKKFHFDVDVEEL